MRFCETRLPGVFEIHIEPHRDDRGFFARSWCQKEFEAQGLNPRLVQCNISFNARKGTLRGMHFQAPPYAEAKVVRCTKGAIYDVVLDLRPTRRRTKTGSPLSLTAANRHMVYVPEGCAHGFLTWKTRPKCSIRCRNSTIADSARGVRWNDPAFAIIWPERLK